MTTFSVKILGAGSASPVLGRWPTAHLLTHNHEHYLIDCGEGTQYRLLEAKARLGKLNTIFISHLHGDHYFGLLPLISSLNLSGRTTDLHLLGPRGLDEIVRLHLRLSQTPLGFKIVFTEIDSEKSYQIFEDNHVTVESIPLNHRIACAGFLFREKEQKRKIISEKLPENIDHQHIKKLKDGEDVYDENGQLLYKANDLTTSPPPPKSYAFCSDTCYDERIVNYITGVDVLYHEATFLEDLAVQARERYHATARDAATIAQKAQANRLIIGHFSTRYKEFSAFLAEAKGIFENTELATEGAEFEI